MKGGENMKRTIVILSVIVSSIALTSGIIYAAGMEADWLRVGSQDTGGVTYFNGTIINETTGTGGADNPVTFGDNVRIDGRVYRGATAGTDDSLPFIVNDNMEIKGSLTIDGGITFGTSDTISFIVNDDVEITGNLAVTGSITADSYDSKSAGEYSFLDSIVQISPTVLNTYYDIGDGLTMTTGNSKLFCMFSADVWNSSGDSWVSIKLEIDGEEVENSTRNQAIDDLAISDTQNVATSTIQNVDAGEHTIVAQWSAATNTTAYMSWNTLDCIEL